MKRKQFVGALLTLALSASMVAPHGYAYAYEGNVPSSYDLNAEKLVTPAKSQGPWSSCWAFGALSSIESNMIKKGYANDSVDLSERYLIWFATEPISKETALKQPSALLNPDKHSQEGEGEYILDPNKSNRFDLGQYDWAVASALSSGLKIQDESACPYQNREGSLSSGQDIDGKPFSIPDAEGDWTVSGSRADETTYRLAKAMLIPGTAINKVDEETGDITFEGYRDETIDEVKRTILDNGAVTLNYAADESEPDQEEDITTFNYENWAQYRDEPALADHAVSIIGWDDSFPKEKFANASGQLPPKDGAWKVKNSWGRKNGGDRNTSSWGVNDEGWFYLSYYDKGIESFQTYDIQKVEGQPLDIMQYDFIGMNNYGFTPIMFQTGLFDTFFFSNNPRVANVFEAPYNLEISEVSFAPHIESGKVTFSIYVLNEDALDPEDGLLVYSNSEEFKHPGYYTHKLDEPIIIGKGMKFSIVEEIEGSFEDDLVYEIPVEIGYDETFTENLEEGQEKQDAIYKTVVNPGESYCYADEWMDNTTLSSNENFNTEGLTYGNNLIKAFVAPTDKEVPNYAKQRKIKLAKDVAVDGVVFGALFYGVVTLRRKHKQKKELQAAVDNPTDAGSESHDTFEE